MNKIISTLRCISKTINGHVNRDVGRVVSECGRSRHLVPEQSWDRTPPAGPLERGPNSGSARDHTCRQYGRFPEK